MLAEQAQGAPELRHVGLFHLSEDNGPVHVAGRPFRALIRLLRGVTASPVLDRAGLHAFVQTQAEAGAETQDFFRAVRNKLPVVSVVLAGVSGAMFLLKSAWQGAIVAAGGFPDWALGAIFGPEVWRGDYWRLFSGPFLHGDVTHLLVNMMALYFLGPLLEAVLGRSRYIALYLGSALGGALASALFTKGLSVGASGAIWGLLGGCYALSLRPQGFLPSHVAPRFRSRLRGPLLINVGISFVPGIDMAAHFGGGAVGFILIFSGLLTVSASRPGVRESVGDRAMSTNREGIDPTTDSDEIAGAPAKVTLAEARPPRAGHRIAAIFLIAAATVALGFAVSHGWQVFQVASSL